MLFNTFLILINIQDNFQFKFAKLQLLFLLPISHMNHKL